MGRRGTPSKPNKEHMDCYALQASTGDYASSLCHTEPDLDVEESLDLRA
ncbi:MAG: hypothetical protein ACOH2E_01015 [Candidatus Paracaedibacter sp.]